VTDNEDVTMRASFYGGPADGGELILREPIMPRFTFPMTPVQLVARCAPNPNSRNSVPNYSAADYHLLLEAPDKPWRDREGRIRYCYVLPTPTPKEDHE
jgi:hypothetical protein